MLQNPAEIRLAELIKEADILAPQIAQFNQHVAALDFLPLLTIEGSEAAIIRTIRALNNEQLEKLTESINSANGLLLKAHSVHRQLKALDIVLPTHPALSILNTFLDFKTLEQVNALTLLAKKFDKSITFQQIRLLAASELTLIVEKHKDDGEFKPGKSKFYCPVHTNDMTGEFVFRGELENNKLAAYLQQLGFQIELANEPGIYNVTLKQADEKKLLAILKQMSLFMRTEPKTALSLKESIDGIIDIINDLAWNKIGLAWNESNKGKTPPAGIAKLREHFKAVTSSSTDAELVEIMKKALHQLAPVVYSYRSQQVLLDLDYSRPAILKLKPRQFLISMHDLMTDLVASHETSLQLKK